VKGIKKRLKIVKKMVGHRESAKENKA
jgi:hypothetical protein